MVVVASFVSEVSSIFVSQQAGRAVVLEVGWVWYWVVNCHFCRMGNRPNNPLFLDSRRRGVDSRGRQRGFVLGLVRRRPTFSRGCTNQPVKAPRTAKGGLIPLFSALLGRRRIKGSVCLMRCHACISMLQAGGGKTSSGAGPSPEDRLPAKQQGAIPSLQAAVTMARDRSVSSLAFNTAIQRRLFLTALVNSRPTERVLEPLGSSSADRPSHSVINELSVCPTTCCCTTSLSSHHLLSPDLT